MSDMVPEVLNAALDSLFTPKEPGELEYQGDDGLLYCRNCHTPVQWMLWVQSMNSIRCRAEEIIKTELIYC